MPITEQISKLSGWQRWLILLLILIVLGGIWYFLLYKPVYTDMDKLRAEIRKLDSQIQRQRLAKIKRKKLQDEIKRIERNLKILQAKLPEEKEIPALLSTVTEMGRLNGLRFNLFKKEKEIPKDYYTEIPVKIQVRGGFHEVASFLYKIGTMPRIIHVSELKMGKYKRDDSGGNLEASFKATTYKYEVKQIVKESSSKKRKKRKRKK
jgi:type IV pilus assembly protein PilO